MSRSADCGVHGPRRDEDSEPILYLAPSVQIRSFSKIRTCALRLIPLVAGNRKMSANFGAVFGSCSFALVTQFKGEEDEDQPVDFPAFEALVEWPWSPDSRRVDGGGAHDEHR